ncbi:MAG: CDP-glycerol glycerophosphotransferase family protein [Saccharofermentans sp.]|nr:CDP-glycerol glycerophosphotransferase family protein [Saccharofermentans sp.]
MKQRIINTLKYNKVVYFLYYYIVSFCINVLKLFVRTDDKLILFNSYAGRKFDDSPKAIFDVMKNDHRFSDYRIVWAFHNPEKYDGINKIKTDGLKYFVTALKARVWVTNSSVERGLNFTGKNTLYFNTWHGTPMKKMGTDIDKANTSFGSKGKNHTDIMMSQGRFETDIFSRAFGISKDKFLEAGLPRNDILADHSDEYRSQIRRNLGIEAGKAVILYAPTFREYEKDENYGVVMAPPIDLNLWQESLPDCVLLMRAHYEVSKVMDIKDNEFVRNVTSYPDINDLYIAADILISDYSSVFFDYSITGKPMLHFTYDYDKYSSKRGMYFDIRDYINGADSQEGVIELIKNIECSKESQRTIAFRDKYVNFYGKAAQAAVDRIAKELNI